MKKKKEIKVRTLEQLVDDLQQPLNFLSYQFNIAGLAGDDIKQLLYIMVVETYNQDKEFHSNRTLGWWFIRCRWHLLNLAKKSENDPLNNSIDIDKCI